MLDQLFKREDLREQMLAGPMGPHLNVLASRLLQLGYTHSQARKLVRTGPYKVVRHPLYLAEEVALLGMLLQCFSPLTLALFLVHAALQVRRTFYEDNLLRRAFPGFDEYARSTPRLIPYVW